MPLSGLQLRAIDVLLVAPSVPKAAKRLKVDASTVRRWMHDPEFAAELGRAQREAIKQNLRGVTSMAADAIRTIRALMANAADDEIKLKAAQEALERLFDADLVMRADESHNGEAIPGSDGSPSGQQ